MMQPVLSIIGFKLVLWTISSIFITEGFSISFRLKRNDEALPPDILRIRYNHHGKVNSVFLKKISDSTLVGPFLRVWLLGRIGEWSGEYQPYTGTQSLPTFYHGVNSFSAVTYFPSTATLHGVIDRRFYIENMPLRAADRPDSVDTFLHLIPNELNHVINTRNKRGMNEKRKSDGITKCSLQKKFKGSDKKKMLYPEIFLALDISSRRIDTTLEDDFGKSIMYVLAYWNAIDMLFRNLKRTDMRINIVGILIGMKESIGDSGFVNSRNIRVIDSNVFLSKSKALDNLGTYFYNILTIERNSYDFLIWMTSTTLVDADAWYEEDSFLCDIAKGYRGASPAPADCGGMRYDESNMRMISNRAIVEYDDEFAQYHTAARELAHLMFVFDDDLELLHGHHHSNCLLSDLTKQSSGIMDPSNERLEGYLLWSYCSEIYFERYSRSQSSCCLFNYPIRTLGIPELPKYLTIKSQCECYGMRAYNSNIYSIDVCNEHLECENPQGWSTKIGFPLDGTPCALEGQEIEGFCSHGECL